MNRHTSAEELLDLYYGGLPAEAARHLESCLECQVNFKDLRETLDAARDYPPPERGAGYGGEVWARVAPLLEAPAKPRRVHWWLLTPAFAALLTLAFMLGRWSTPPRVPQAGISGKARERVLLLSLSDHLERSQIVLTELANGERAEADFAPMRERSRELLGANRLLRQAAERIGDVADAAVLEDLEHVLLEVSNAPDTPSLSEAAFLRRRIQDKELLFKVRISSADSRERGMKL